MHWSTWIIRSLCTFFNPALYAFFDTIRPRAFFINSRFVWPVVFTFSRVPLQTWPRVPRTNGFLAFLFLTTVFRFFGTFFAVVFRRRTELFFLLDFLVVRLAFRATRRDAFLRLTRFFEDDFRVFFDTLPFFDVFLLVFLLVLPIIQKRWLFCLFSKSKKKFHPDNN